MHLIKQHTHRQLIGKIIWIVIPTLTVEVKPVGTFQRFLLKRLSFVLKGLNKHLMTIFLQCIWPILGQTSFSSNHKTHRNIVSLPFFVITVS